MSQGIGLFYFRVEPRLDWPWDKEVPLHRSLVFWMGLCLLVFLAWAWNRSTMWGDEIGFPVGGDWVVVMSYDAKLETTRYVDLATKTGRHELDWFSRWRAGSGAWVGWPDFHRTVTDTPTGVLVSYTGQTPWWFLIVCHLPIWLGWSAWRARRIARVRQAG